MGLPLQVQHPSVLSSYLGLEESIQICLGSSEEQRRATQSCLVILPKLKGKQWEELSGGTLTYLWINGRKENIDSLVGQSFTECKQRHTKHGLGKSSLTL